MTYDELLMQYENLNIKEVDLSEIDPEEEFSGLYADGNIFIRHNIPTLTEKACTLAEEVGHHYTTSGNILDQTRTSNRKQERKARAWAYEKMIPLTALLEAYWAGVRNRFELAEFLDVTEQFLQEALDYFKQKYGLFYSIDNYLICFDPLSIYEDRKGVV